MSNIQHIHILPLNDIREHEPDENCWCYPSLEEEGWQHKSLDGREFIEQLDLVYGQVPAFLAEAGFAYSDSSRLTEDTSNNLLLALRWLDKRASLLRQNPLIKDVKRTALTLFIERFYVITDEDRIVAEILTELSRSKGSMKPADYFQLAKTFEIPAGLLLNKTATNLIVDKDSLTMLAVYAYKNEFISFSRVSELLCIDAAETKQVIKDFTDRS